MLRMRLRVGHSGNTPRDAMLHRAGGLVVACQGGPYASGGHMSGDHQRASIVCGMPLLCVTCGALCWLKSMFHPSLRLDWASGWAIACHIASDCRVAWAFGEALLEGHAIGEMHGSSRLCLACVHVVSRHLRLFVAALSGVIGAPLRSLLCDCAMAQPSALLGDIICGHMQRAPCEGRPSRRLAEGAPGR